MNEDKLLDALKCCAVIHGCKDCPIEYGGRECKELCSIAYTLITQQQAEIDHLTALNKEAAGLLELTVEDMQHCSDGLDCEACGNSTCAGFDVCRFVWQHADRCEALKKKMGDTP